LLDAVDAETLRVRFDAEAMAARAGAVHDQEGDQPGHLVRIEECERSTKNHICPGVLLLTYPATITRSRVMRMGE
jgi:hypothetical protein